MTSFPTTGQTPLWGPQLKGYIDERDGAAVDIANDAVTATEEFNARVDGVDARVDGVDARVDTLEDLTTTGRLSTSSLNAAFAAESVETEVTTGRLSPGSLVRSAQGVLPLTTAQRNALTGVELWDGRLILNTTTDRINRYDLGTASWVEVPDTADIAALLATSGTPAAPAVTGDRGVSTSAARADHVHPMPAWQSWTVVNTGGVAFASGYTARYQMLGKTVHARFRGAVFSNIDGTSIRVPLPVAPHGSYSVDDCIGTGAIHNPGVFKEACIAGYSLIGSTPAVLLWRTIVANSTVSYSNPGAMSGGDEVFTFSITYEAA